MNIASDQSTSTHVHDVFSQIRALRAQMPQAPVASVNQRELISLGVFQQEIVDVQALFERYLARLGSDRRSIGDAMTYDEWLSRFQTSEEVSPDDGDGAAKGEASDGAALVAASGTASSSKGGVKSVSGSGDSSGDASAGADGASGGAGTDPGVGGGSDPVEESGDGGEAGDSGSGAGAGDGSGDGGGDDDGLVGGLLDLLF